MVGIKKEVLAMIFINVLWGVIPLPAAHLFTQYSIFLVLFIRLFFAGISLLLITFFLIIITNRKNRAKSRLYQIKLKDFGQYLNAGNPDFFGIRQWGYLLITAITGIDLQLIFFFWGIKMVGAVVTAIGYIIGLIILAIFNRMTGKEEIKGFRLLYLLILIISMMMMGFISQTQNVTNGANPWSNFSFTGISIALLYGVFLAIFFILSSADRMTAKEYGVIRVEPLYGSIRTSFKLGVLLSFSSIILIPLLYVMQFVPFSLEALQEIEKFFFQLPHWFEIALLPNSLILTFVCTVLTYVVYFFLATFWPKNSSFDLWAGVLSLVEPVGNIIVGVAFLNENFPIPWLIVIILLLTIGIFIRYLSESQAQIHAIIFFKVSFGYNWKAMVEAYKIKQVRRITDLLGEHDFMAEILTNSESEFMKIIEHDIHNLPGLISYQIMHITRIETDKTTPEAHKGESILKRMQIKEIR